MPKNSAKLKKNEEINLQILNLKDYKIKSHKPKGYTFVSAVEKIKKKDKGRGTWKERQLT